MVNSARASEDFAEDEVPFESRQAVVNGVSIFLTRDYDAGEGAYEMTFSSLPNSADHETIKTDLPVSVLTEAFENAVASVPAGHPQRLYIAYGITRQFLRQKEMEREAEEKRQRGEKARVLQAEEVPDVESSGISYRESRTINGIKMSVAWDMTVDEFIISFDDHPEEMEGASDHGIIQSDISLGQNSETAKRVFEYACARARFEGKKGIFRVYNSVSDMVDGLNR